jgi:hypothetical protein
MPYQLVSASLLAGIMGIALAACNSGATNSQTFISVASSGQCSPMAPNNCTITLTYNTGGIANLSFGYIATPQNQLAFNLHSPLAECPVPQGLTGTQTCSFVVPFDPSRCNSANSQETVTFTLNGAVSATSNPITLSCTPIKG